jgi:hypothetical protein
LPARLLRALRPEGDPAEAAAYVDDNRAPEAICTCRAAAPRLRDDLVAMRILSGAGYGLIRPLLSDPTTLGSLMRRKLAPVIDALQTQIGHLRTSAD